jgi:hypothetical protein
MDIQPTEDLPEVFRTFIEKFEEFFDDTDFRVILRRDESNKVDYIFEVLDKNNDDIVIAEVNFKKIKPFPNLGLTQSNVVKNIVPIITPIPFFLHISKIFPTAGPGTVIKNKVFLGPST